jgi:hypothetical protein
MFLGFGMRYTNAKKVAAGVSLLAVNALAVAFRETALAKVFFAAEAIVGLGGLVYAARQRGRSRPLLNIGGIEMVSHSDMSAALTTVLVQPGAGPLDAQPSAAALIAQAVTSDTDRGSPRSGVGSGDGWSNVPLDDGDFLTPGW